MVQRSKDNPVHIVVTGRPVNFTSKSFRPEDIKASGKSIIKLLPRDENEKDDPTDGELVTLDTICRFDRFLKVRVGRKLFLYNGLVSHAPVSHKMHVRVLDGQSEFCLRSIRGRLVMGEVLCMHRDRMDMGVVTRVPRHKGWADIYCSAQPVFKKVDVHFLRRLISNYVCLGQQTSVFVFSLLRSRSRSIERFVVSQQDESKLVDLQCVD